MRYALGVLTACIEHDPELIMLDQGDRRLNILEMDDDRWALVRKKCKKPLLELKKRS